MPPIDTEDIEQSQPVDWNAEMEKFKTNRNSSEAVQRGVDAIKKYEKEYLPNAMQMFRNNLKKSKEIMPKIRPDDSKVTRPAAEPNFFAALLGLVTV